MNRKSNTQVIVLLTRYDVIRVSWDAYPLQVAEVLYNSSYPEPQQNHLKFLKCKPCLTRRQQHPFPSSLKLTYFTPVSWGKWLSHQMISSLDNEPQEHPIVRDSNLRGMALFYGLLLGSPPFSVYNCLKYLMSVRTLLMMITLGFMSTSTSSELQTHISNYPLDIST